MSCPWDVANAWAKCCRCVPSPIQRQDLRSTESSPASFQFARIANTVFCSPPVTCTSPSAVDEDVDLASDAELVEVNSGLDREAGPAQDQALVVRFEVVHVGAVAVDFLADVVADAVNELWAVTGLRRSRCGRPRRPPSRGAAGPRHRRCERIRSRHRGRGPRWRKSTHIFRELFRRRSPFGSGRCRPTAAGRAWPRGRSAPGRSARWRRPCRRSARSAGRRCAARRRRSAGCKSSGRVDGNGP